MLASWQGSDSKDSGKFVVMVAASSGDVRHPSVDVVTFSGTTLGTALRFLRQYNNNYLGYTVESIQ